MGAKVSGKKADTIEEKTQHIGTGFFFIVDNSLFIEGMMSINRAPSNGETRVNYAKGSTDITTKTSSTAFANGVAPVTNKIYKRPNDATTPAQRASVQGKPCVDRGGSSTPMVADHKTTLVEEHYNTGKIDTKNMHSLNAVQPQCMACSYKQGAQMSKYSKSMKKIINGRK